MARKISQELVMPGINISFDRLGLSLFPFPSVQLSGMLVRVAPNAESNISLYVDKCLVRPNWMDIFQGQLSLNSISLIHPVALIQSLAKQKTKASQESESNSESEFDFSELVESLAMLSHVNIAIQNGIVEMQQEKTFQVNHLEGNVVLPDFLALASSQTQTQASLNMKMALDNFSCRLDCTVQLSYTTSGLSLSGEMLVHGDIPMSGQAVVADLRVPFRLASTIPDPTASLSGLLTDAMNVALPQLDEKIRPRKAKKQSSKTQDDLKKKPETPQPIFYIDSAKLQIDKDTATLNGRFLLGNLLSFLQKDLQNDPMLEGSFEVHHFSLPRWFEFVSVLPDGMYALLDNLKGKSHFTLTQKSLIVDKLEASAGKIQATGSCSIPNLSKPVVMLQIKTQKADLGTLLPEIEGRKVSIKKYTPFIKSEPNLPRKNLSFDIQISADHVQHKNIALQGVSCRIRPFQEDGVRVDASAVLSSGKVSSTLLLGKDARLTLSLNDMQMESLSTRLFGKSYLSGIASAEADLRRIGGFGKSLNDFLAKLQISLNVFLKNGVVQKIPFKSASFAFQGQGLSGTKDTLPLTGKWRATVNTSDWQGEAQLDGKVAISTRTWHPSIMNMPCRLTASLADWQVTSNALFSFDTSSIKLTEMHGDLRSTKLASPITMSGKVEITEKDQTADLQGQWDKTTFNLALSGLTAVSKKISLSLNQINVDKYFPSSTKKSPQSQKKQLFSLPSSLKSVDLSGQVHIDQLTVFKLDHKNLQIPFTFRQGVLTADPITAQLCEGKIGSGFRAELSGDNANLNKVCLRVRHTLKGIDLTTFSRVLKMDTQLMGKASFEGDVHGCLQYSDDFPKALSGNCSIAVKNGGILSEKKQPTARFDLLSATAQLTKGVLTNQDLTLSGKGISAGGHGKVDLVKNTLDYFIVASLSGIPRIPVHFYGSLDNPERDVSAVRIAFSALGNIGGGIFTLLEYLLTSTPF